MINESAIDCNYCATIQSLRHSTDYEYLTKIDIYSPPKVKHHQSIFQYSFIIWQFSKHLIHVHETIITLMKNTVKLSIDKPLNI